MCNVQCCIIQCSVKFKVHYSAAFIAVQCSVYNSALLCSVYCSAVQCMEYKYRSSVTLAFRAALIRELY